MSVFKLQFDTSCGMLKHINLITFHKTCSSKSLQCLRMFKSIICTVESWKPTVSPNDARVCITNGAILSATTVLPACSTQSESGTATAPNWASSAKFYAASTTAEPANGTLAATSSTKFHRNITEVYVALSSNKNLNSEKTMFDTAAAEEL